MMFKWVFFLILSFSSQVVFTQAYLEWVHQIGIENDLGDFEMMLDAAVDNNNNVILYGSFLGEINLDFKGGEYILQSSTSQNQPFIVKYDSSGNILWAKKIGGSEYFYCNYSIVIDSLNNIYLTGCTSDTAYLDYETDTYIYNDNIVSGITLGNAYIAKYDETGEFIWVNEISGGYHVYIQNLKISNNGVYFSIRSTTDSVTISGVTQPTILGHDTLLNPSLGVIFLLDYDGNYQSSYTLSMSFNNGGFIFDIDPNGFLYLGGRYSNDFYFENEDSLQFSNTTAIFISKFDYQLTYLWSKEIGLSSDNSPWITNIEALENSFLVSGITENTIDIDPSINSYLLTSIAGEFSNSDGFLAEYDSEGNLIQGFILEGSEINGILKHYRTEQNENFLLLHYMDTLILDSTLFYTKNINHRNFILAKLNSNYEIDWYKEYTNIYQAMGLNSSLLFKDDYFYLSFGFRDSILADQSTQLFGSGNSDIFLGKYSLDKCYNTRFEFDSLNHITCSNPQGFASVSLNNQNNNSYLSWSTIPETNDTFIQVTQPGLYNFTISDSSDCNINRWIFIDGPDSSTSLDIGVNLISNAQFRPLTNTTVDLNLKNNGCLSTDGQLILEFDTLISLISSYPPPDSIYNSKLFWNYFDLNYDDVHFSPELIFETSISANIGDVINFKLTGTPINDEDSLNNQKWYSFDVVNSYDPNLKRVYPQGDIFISSIDNDFILTYTILFQNTGNAPAINVNIIDTLSTLLDIKTIDIVETSHNMNLEIKESTANFIFKDIYLPDSVSNEPESHGYIVFNIGLIENINLGDIIENEVYIYFDFNEPIITNKTITEIISPLNNNQLSLETFKIFPNPFNDNIYFETNNKVVNTFKIMIYGINGEIIFEKIVNESNYVSLSDLKKGFYLMQVISGKSTKMFKIIKD